MSIPYSINIHLAFDHTLAQEPWVCRLSRLFNIEFSITKANVSTKKDGYLILELRGDEDECNKAIKYLSDNNIVVTTVAQRIWHNEEECMDCGLCTALCPTSALYMNTVNNLVFDKSKCVVCLNCTSICPVHALTSDIPDHAQKH